MREMVDFLYIFTMFHVKHLPETPFVQLAQRFERTGFVQVAQRLVSLN